MAIKKIRTKHGMACYNTTTRRFTQKSKCGLTKKTHKKGKR